jgi:hypothetical protein
MPKILISYRRDDSAAYAGRLFDRLSDYFGAEKIFIDIDTIKPGQDFVKTIGDSVIACDAVLAVIGPRWLLEQDRKGQRRLDNPDDLVRMEVATALNGGIQVIPVLVGGAEMPQAADLPGDLIRLARLQALEISDERFHHDIHRLIQALAGGKTTTEPVRLKGPHHESDEGAPSTGGLGRVYGRLPTQWRWGAAAIALIAVVWIGYRLLPIGNGAGVTAVSSGRADSADGSQSAQPKSTSVSADPIDRRTISATSEQGFEVVQGAPPLVKPLPALGTVDKPQAIDLGVTYRFKLEDLDTAYLGVPPVTGLVMVLDMSTPNAERTNLQSGLSVLDRDGAVLIPRAIGFNEIDRGHRKVGIFSVKQQSPLGLKLSNGGKSIVYCLTVFNAARVPFVPLFGEVTPTPMTIGDAASGALDAGEEVFYRVTLKKGNYRAILDFTNTPQDRTNIQGYLAILDAAGGNQTSVLGLNEIDVAFRKIGSFAIKHDGAAIIRIQTAKAVKYTARIVPDPGS